MILPEKIAQLAGLYDRFAHVRWTRFLRIETGREDAFRVMLEHLRCSYAPRVEVREFRREAIRQCKLFLKRN